jgi:hypothetical protein
VGLGIVFETDRHRGSGTQGFLRRMEGLSTRGRDMTPALQEIHRQFLATERGIFSSGGVGRTHWQPLTPKYARQKAKRGLDPRIERATGVLARALTTGTGEGAVTEISNTGATFGTSLARAVYAHRGSGRVRRRLITIDRRRRNRWVETLRTWIVEGRVGRR